MGGLGMTDVVITDSNFEREVLKSDKPVLVDFWAVWCVAPETSIAQDVFVTKSAQSVRVGERLIGWNNQLTSGTVTYSQTTTDGGHCRRIQSVSGRNIKLTDDHLVYTKKGWIRANDVKVGDVVAILPMREPIEPAGERTIIVDEKDVQRFASAGMRWPQYLDELMHKGLLPLHSDDSRVVVLARLAGSLFTDGTLYQGTHNYREVSFVLGSMEDVKQVVADLSTLGFLNVHVAHRTHEASIGGRTFHEQSYRVKCLSTALYLLLRALGVPEGRKLSQRVTVPAWIKTTARGVKREFLSGILGGDGPRVSMFLQTRGNKLPYNSLSINDYEFHKQEDLITDGLAWARDLQVLFGEFGVKVTRIFVDKASFHRHDGTRTRTIHIRFTRNVETGVALSQYIGYAYARDKQEESARVGEFLRIILAKRTHWQALYRKAKALAGNGVAIRAIADALRVSYDTVFGWIRLGKKATVAYHRLKFPEWLKEATRQLDGGLLWQEVVQVSSVYLPAVQRISVAPTHNFIANGFLVHNCGPCVVQGPIVEEVATAMAGKAKVGKLNVDENPQMAQKYMVMSIPTIMIFKNGTIVKQFVGVQSKETLVGELNKLIN